MSAKKQSAKSDTRITYKVDRAFVHEGVYYAGRDVPEIGELPPEVIKDRIERGYIREFRATSAAPEHVTPAQET